MRERAADNQKAVSGSMAEWSGDFLFHVSLTKKLDRCSMQWRRESVINACQNILVRSVMRASVGRSRSL